jgi:hypothetical protein
MVEVFQAKKYRYDLDIEGFWLCDKCRIRAVICRGRGRQMITFGIWRWNDAKGGMRFAFPPYGPAPLGGETF